MRFLSDLTAGMLAIFESKDRAREETLRLSRGLVRNCSIAIRCMHRGELTEAERLLTEAKSTLRKIQKLLRDHQDIRYAGFVNDAEQELAEANFIYSLISGCDIPAYDEIGVDMINYLSGLGDATGELRRHILDLIRIGKPEEGEYFLEVMEEIHSTLMLFDYPDAITRGLRRKSDLARSMLERTSGDLTNAMEMAKLAKSIQASE
ncbi:MAG: translin family protein [Methanotrichaceae archaeon]|nr:translin family protein [Methanotrichaceae archaeon]